MKASAVLEEVLVNCDNCGKNIKTAQGFKDHSEQAHQNLPKSHKYKCDQCNYQNINEKRLKQHWKLKQQFTIWRKKMLVIFSSVELVRNQKLLNKYLKL